MNGGSANGGSGGGSGGVVTGGVSANTFDFFTAEGPVVDHDISMGDNDMMDYMNFEDSKNDYSSMLFPPGEQETVMTGIVNGDVAKNSPPQPAAAQSPKDAQEYLQKLTFGKVYSNGEKTEPLERNENYTMLLNGQDHSTYKYNVHVGELPLKSRVETQIKCRLAISPTPDEHLIHLPTDTIARPKFQLQEPFQPSPGTLNLEVDVVSQANPDTPIYICQRCMNREKKRAFRKKNLDQNEQLHWSIERKRRLVIFNCKEVVALTHAKACDFGSNQFIQGKEVELPIRLACYCRHHSAKEGFRMVFTLRDHNDAVVGRTVTPPIFITDDHKDSKQLQNGGTATTASSAHTTPPGNSPHHMVKAEIPSPASLEESSEAFSDQSSTYSLKRRRDEGWNGSTRPAGYGFSRVSSTKSMPQYQQQQQQQQGPRLDLPSPQSSDGLQIMPLTQMQSQSQAQGQSQSQSQSNNSQVPHIQRIIPGQGSVRGGVEITLLGTGFNPGLVAVFGDSKSMSTQCWSESTIVTHLPPASAPGPVVVTFDGVIMSNPQIFTYIDDTDRQLIELALQVVGMKMNGKLEDARNIAMRIVNQDDDGRNGAAAANGSAGSTGSGAMEHGSSASDDHQGVILRCIELVKNTTAGKLPNWQLCNTEGQTMMHLAASMGYTKVINALVSQGARIDLNDVNGMSPLHFAALHGHRQIVERLINHGADPFNMTKSGCTVMDMAQQNLQDLLPMAMSRREYTQNWVASRTSSSSTLGSMFSDEVVNHEPFTSYSTEEPEFDMWEENSSDYDSGYDNDDLDDDLLDSEDEKLAQHFENQNDKKKLQQQQQKSKKKTTAQNISHYFAQLGHNAKNGWDLKWDDVLNYIYRPPSQHDNETQHNDGDSDSDTTVSPRNNIIPQRVWKYFMPPVPEDKEPPRYDEIFPESANDAHPDPPVASSSNSNNEKHTITTVANATASTSTSNEEYDEQKYLETYNTNRKQLRNDRMLFFFWLPVLLAVLMMFTAKYTGLVTGIDIAGRDKFEQFGSSIREFLTYHLLGRQAAPGGHYPQSTGLTVVESTAMIVAP